MPLIIYTHYGRLVIQLTKGHNTLPKWLQLQLTKTTGINTLYYYIHIIYNRQRLSHKRVLETPETSTGEDDDDKNWNEDMETEDLDVQIPSLVTRPKKMKSMYSEDTSREDEDLGKMRSNREEEGTKDLRMKLTTSNNKKGLKSRLGQMKT